MTTGVCPSDCAQRGRGFPTKCDDEQCYQDREEEASLAWFQIKRIKAISTDPKLTLGVTAILVDQARLASWAARLSAWHLKE